MKYVQVILTKLIYSFLLFMLLTLSKWMLGGMFGFVFFLFSILSQTKDISLEINLFWFRNYINEKVCCTLKNWSCHWFAFFIRPPALPDGPGKSTLCVRSSVGNMVFSILTSYDFLICSLEIAWKWRSPFFEEISYAQYEVNETFLGA